MSFKIPIVLLLALFMQINTYAQLNESEIKHFSVIEDSLRKIQLRVFHSKIYENKINANKQFIALWNELLKDEKTLQYPFDSLKKDNEISLLFSPDKKFRIITWNILRDDETHVYFGFIQVNNSKTVKKGIFKKETTPQYDVFPLVDKSSTITTNIETYVGEPSKWFGMLYYGTITKSDEDYYTLTAWDGNTKLTCRKFIDVIWFKPDGTPQFGKDIFKVPNKFLKRMMFEYASEVVMSLKYNEQRKQLIFSHLAPNTPESNRDGQLQYYGPDGTFDALSTKKGKWVLTEDIDIRKIKDKNDNAKKPDPNKQKPFYKAK